MKKYALIIMLALAASCSPGKGPVCRFEPYVIDNLEPRPEFWKVRPEEIISVCENVEAGHTEIIATTPLGNPVYAVFYGDFSEEAPQTNWSAGNSSSTRAAYLGDVSSRPQTLMFAAGIHGSEPECVAAAVNMISLLETGKDLKGEGDQEFLDLASRYRLIILPCVNMDGRSISPDHFRGQPYEVFRACSQGVWKDSTLVEWKGSKKYFPLPLDKVSFPGGYPNGDGYNIQHDVTPGDMRTEEAKALCRLMARWRVDCFLNGHSCEYQPFAESVGNVDTPSHTARGQRISDKVNDALFDAGLRTKGRYVPCPHNTINITNMVNLASGGLGILLECSHSYDNIHSPSLFYTFEQLMEPAFVTMKIIMEDGLESPLAERE